MPLHAQNKTRQKEARGREGVKQCRREKGFPKIDSFPVSPNLTAVPWLISFYLHIHRKYEWSLCPEGYFLSGLYRNDGKKLSNIIYTRCCRPGNHPNKYESCYDEDVQTSLEKQVWSNCSHPERYTTTKVVPDEKFLEFLIGFNSTLFWLIRMLCISCL